jgi:hypothetical protein
MNIPIATNFDLKAEFELAIAWMGDIGVSIGPGRIEYYKAGLDLWLDPGVIGDVAAAQAAFPKVASAAYEVPCFLEVYAAFKGTPLEELGPLAVKLNKAVAGPFDLSDENNENSTARNFLFEAIVAAKFHRPLLGMKALANPKSDSGFTAGNNTILIESKRLGSIHQVEKRLREGRNQLNKNLNGLPVDHNMGMIAFDISRLVNPNGMIYATELEENMNRETASMIDVFLREQDRLFDQVLPEKNPRIVAIVVRLSVLARSNDKQKMVINNQWAGVALRGTTPRQVDFLRKVFKAIHQMPESTLWRNK